MIYFVVALGGLLVWWFIGCGVFAAIDKDERLLRWVESGPWFAWPLVVTGWPVVAWKFTCADKSTPRAE